MYRGRVSRAWLHLAFVAALVTTRVASSGEPAEPSIERLTRTFDSKFFVHYSPDGSHIVYSRHHRNRRQSNRVLVGARIIKADGSDDRPLLTEFDAQVQIQEHPSFSPDGTKLLISGGGNDTGNSAKDTFVCDVDPGFRASNLRKLVPGNGVNVGEEPIYSPDGKRIAFTTVDETIWVIDADGKNKTKVMQASGQYCHQPAWSPDGRWIAFASDRDGNIELYKVRLDGTELTRLTTESGIDCRPRWSPDGRWILFSSNRHGNFDLFVMSTDGGDVRRLTTNAASDDHGDWSPDGKSIAFVSMRDGGFDIYRLNVPPEVAMAALLGRPSDLAPDVSTR
ncbi:MAG: hypothetical protein WD648_16220 [Planctomycetaceae bacterium]